VSQFIRRPVETFLPVLIDGAAGMVRRVVPRGSILFRNLKRLRTYLPRRDIPSRVERMFTAFAAQYPRAYFIQIGSNDGSNLDPLRPFILRTEWRGILVEPVPYIFTRLVENYRGRAGLILENVAVGELNGTSNFYYLRKADNPTELPVWYETLGSFSREVILTHKDSIPDIEDRLVCEPVTCVTFDTLCRRHGVEGVDLIHIEAEGYDFRIIQQIDLGRLNPRILMFEHHHLSAADRIACRALLEKHGYEGFREELDTLCLNLRHFADRDRPLFELWKELKDPPTP
jgi:FkbM family methyltransferase